MTIVRRSGDYWRSIEAREDGTVITKIGVGRRTLIEVETSIRAAENLAERYKEAAENARDTEDSHE